MRDTILFLEVPNSGVRAKYYEAARSLGLLPVAVTKRGSRSNKLSGSDSLPVANMDVDTVLAALDRIGKERIAGVFASGSARAELAARLAAALGLPHADPDAISLCDDKRRLRDFLAARGLNTVDYQHVTTLANVYAAAERLGGSVVVKPISSTGSDGVRICETPDEAVVHSRKLLKRKSDGVLIERFIDGPMLSVELFDGKALVVKRNYISEGPFPITVGTETPARLENELASEIKNYAASIIRDVGLISGPSAVQLSVSGGEKYLIEINPRPFLNSTVDTFVATNINMAVLCLKFSCGIPYAQEFCVSQKSRACATRYLVRNGSSVRAVRGSEEARKTPHVIMVDVNDSNFHRGGPATGALDHIAIIHSAADNIDLATDSVETAFKALSVVYDGFPIDRIKYHARKIGRLW